MADTVMLILSIVVILLAGAAVLAALRPAVTGFFTVLSLSFLIGLGAVSLQMFLYSLASIKFGFLVVALPWACLFALARFVRRGGGPSCGCDCADAGEKAGWTGYILFLIILSQVLYSFAYSSLLPVRGWDSWLIWFFKARVFFIDGGVDGAFLLNPDYAYSHPDYPLLVPLSVAWVYTALGHAAEMQAKILYPLQFASMLFIFNYAVKKVSGPSYAMLFTTLLSLTPIILVHAGGFPSSVGPLAGGDYVGYADLMLSICFLSAGVFLYLGMTGGGSSHLVLSAIFLGLGAWTKNEGLPLAAFGLLLIAVHSIAGRRDWKPLVISACVLALFILPWSAYKARLALESDLAGAMSLSVFIANAGRLKLVLATALDYMFFQTGLFTFTWWAFVASAVLNWRGFGSRPLLFLYLLLFFQLSLYLFVYVVTPFDVLWHMRTSIDRLILHMAPLAMLIAAFNAGALLRGVAGPRGPDGG